MPSRPIQKPGETDEEYAIRYRVFRDKANEVNRRARQKAIEAYEKSLVEPKQEVMIPESPPPVPEPPKPEEETKEQKLLRQWEANKAKQREIYQRKKEERKAYSLSLYYKNRDFILAKSQQERDAKKEEKEPPKPLEELTPAERCYETLKRNQKKIYDKKVEEKKANGTYRGRGRPRKYLDTSPPPPPAPTPAFPPIPPSPKVEPTTPRTFHLLVFAI